MELKSYAEIYFRLTARFRPLRFAGTENKSKYSSWRRGIDTRYTVCKKNEGEELTIGNSVLLRNTLKGPRIVVREEFLDTIWEKFHSDILTGGHQG